MNFISRIGVALVFVPVVLLVFILGGFWLTSFGLIIATLAAFELRKILNKSGHKVPFLAVLLTPFFYFGAVYQSTVIMAFIPFYPVLFLLSGSPIQNFKKRYVGTVFLHLYTVLCMAAIVHLDKITTNSYLALHLLILIWINDTFSYFIGMLFGRHRGIFKVSPKKSIEGYIGGFVCTALAIFVLRLFADINMDMAAKLVVAASIFGPAGDLLESWLKRQAKVKDSSKILLGHGGILDRFDSLFIAALALYLLISF